MSQTFRIAELVRRRGVAPYGACVAVVVALALTGCQGSPPPDVRAPDQSVAQLMRVADDTRAGGDPGTAVTLYRRVHEMQPSNAEALAKLGSTLMQVNANTEAVKAYRLAVAAAPKDPETHRGLALALLSLNQPEPALVELKTALNLKPDDPRIYSTLGVAHDLVGRHDLAQQDYQNGLRIAPQHAGLRNNYALSLALSGDYGSAATTLADIANDPAAPPRYVLNLALIYGLAGDDKRAAMIARTALDDAAVRNNLAYYAMLRGMDDKSRAAAIIGGQLHSPPPADYAAITPNASDAKPSTADAAPADKETVATSTIPGDAAVSNDASAKDDAAKDDVAKDDAAKDDAARAATGSMVETSASATTAPEPTGDAATDAPTKLAATDSSNSNGDNANSNDSGNAPPSAPADDATAAPGLMPIMPATPAPALTHSSSSKSASIPPSAPAASSGYSVQLGSFASEANAHRLADQLNAKGYGVSVSHYRDHNGREWFTVRAGNYASADEATAAANRIRDAERVPAVVVRMHASAA
jgi:Flp pilus assembly protein TadD/cell division protein FtsN